MSEIILWTQSQDLVNGREKWLPCQAGIPLQSGAFPSVALLGRINHWNQFLLKTRFSETYYAL